MSSYRGPRFIDPTLLRFAVHGLHLGATVTPTARWRYREADEQTIRQTGPRFTTSNPPPLILKIDRQAVVFLRESCVSRSTPLAHAPAGARVPALKNIRSGTFTAKGFVSACCRLVCTYYGRRYALLLHQDLNKVVYAKQPPSITKTCGSTLALWQSCCNYPSASIPTNAHTRVQKSQAHSLLRSPRPVGRTSTRLPISKGSSASHQNQYSKIRLAEVGD